MGVMLDQLALKLLLLNVHQRKMLWYKQQEIRNCCASIFTDTCLHHNFQDLVVALDEQV